MIEGETKRQHPSARAIVEAGAKDAISRNINGIDGLDSPVAVMAIQEPREQLYVGRTFDIDIGERRL